MNQAVRKPFMEAGFACAIDVTESGWVVSQIATTPGSMQQAGYVQYLPEGGREHAIHTTGELTARIIVHLAGLAAQEKHEGPCVDCGHSMDSVRAIAEHMVMHGMSRLGGGRHISKADIEAECNRIITECKVLAERLVEADSERIAAMVDALVRDEYLEKAAIDRLFAAHPSKVTPDMIDFDPAA